MHSHATVQAFGVASGAGFYVYPNGQVGTPLPAYSYSRMLCLRVLPYQQSTRTPIRAAYAQLYTRCLRVLPYALS
eukprot:2481147-Rhodomonas_salina.1